MFGATVHEAGFRLLDGRWLLEYTVEVETKGAERRGVCGDFDPDVPTNSAGLVADDLPAALLGQWRERAGRVADEFSIADRRKFRRPGDRSLDHGWYRRARDGRYYWRNANV